MEKPKFDKLDKRDFSEVLGAAGASASFTKREIAVLALALTAARSESLMPYTREQKNTLHGMFALGYLALSDQEHKELDAKLGTMGYLTAHRP